MSNATNKIDSHPNTSHASNATDNAPQPLYMKQAPVGYLALLISMVNNAESTQDLISQGMMNLSEAISAQTEAYSNAWTLIMNNPTGDGKADPTYKNTSDKIQAILGF